MNKKKEKIVIIGAGISGMTAGIYALDNGFDVEIYEKHSIVGGQCTGWNRSGVFIDGCAHWIVGTNPKSDLYPLWEHIDGINSDLVIHETEYFTKFDVDGEIVTFYADLKKLEEEFVRIAPEDKKLIKSFIKGIKTYQKVQIPVVKPIDMMNFFELVSYGIKMLPMVPKLLIYMHKSIEEYASKFKSPILKKVFKRILSVNYNIHSLVYIMQALSKKDAGMVEGGSRELAYRVKRRFVEKGGKVFVNKEVDHILIENSKACGIVLKNGEEIKSDYVIAATDAHHTMFELLQGKYYDKYYATRFNDRINNPLSTSFLFSYKVKANMDEKPKMINFSIPPFSIGDLIIDSITLRSHAFDKTLNKDSTTITVLVDTCDSVFDYLKELSSSEYEAEKERCGNAIKRAISSYYQLNDEDISLIDVATPLTYERYTNAYRGSYMAFITTKNVKGLMRPGLIKGLKNFVLAGQWIMPPGGLPIALFSGKHAAIRVCKMAKKKFICLDKTNRKNK